MSIRKGCKLRRGYLASIEIDLVSALLLAPRRGAMSELTCHRRCRWRSTAGYRLRFLRNARARAHRVESPSDTSKRHSICSGEKTQVRLPRSFLKRSGTEIAEERRSLWAFYLCALRVSAFPNSQKSCKGKMRRPGTSCESWQESCNFGILPI